MFLFSWSCWVHWSKFALPLFMLLQKTSQWVMPIILALVRFSTYFGGVEFQIKKALSQKGLHNRLTFDDVACIICKTHWLGMQNAEVIKTLSTQGRILILLQSTFSSRGKMCHVICPIVYQMVWYKTKTYLNLKSLSCHFESFPIMIGKK
jgi:hypothetical protein